MKSTLPVKKKMSYITNLTMRTWFVDITSYMPSDMANFLFATLESYGTVSTHDAISVTVNGRYLLGTAGATIDYVYIAYYYTD